MAENKDDIDLDGWDLHRAAKENRSDIAGALLDRGADIEAKDNIGGHPCTTQPRRTPSTLPPC